MNKRFAIAAVLGLLLVVPTAALAGSGQANGPGPRHRVQKFQKRAAARIHRGVKAGKVNANERAKLREEMQALRRQVQQLRQAGTPATKEQRAALKAQMTQIKQSIGRANRGK